MVEKVTGLIGQDNVELNNAATEATLLRLIQAVQASGGTGAASKTAGLAGAAGVNLNAVNQANSALSALGIKTTPVTQGFATLFTQVAGGIPSVSGVLSGFAGLTGPLGIVVTLFSLLAEFQEKNLETYKNISNVGANFGGSLTDLRMASANAYVTLEQFGKIISENSQTLAKMGGSVNEGAKSFAILSNSLIASDAGSALLSLGYSTEEVNSSMLNYINVTGGRTKQELQNTEAITHATSEYMTELDKLTQFSGASRKQQEEEQKKAALNGAYQRALSNMTEEQRTRAEVARAAAAASGVAGASDLLMSSVAGLPPLTEDAKNLSGKFGEAAAGIGDMANQVRDTNGTVSGVEKGLGRFNEGLSNQVNAMGSSGDALSLSGDKIVNSAQLAAVKLQKSGNDTAAGTAKNLADIDKNQKAQQASQAATMTAANKNLQELGQAVMGIVGPIAAVLTPAFQLLGGVVSLITGTISGVVSVLDAIVTGIIFPFKMWLIPWKIMLNAFITGLTEVGKKLSDALEPIIAPFRKIFQTETGNLGKVFSIIGTAGGILFDVLGTLGEFLLTWPFKIIFGALGIGIDYMAKGFKVLGNIIEFIISPFQALQDWISGFLDSMKDKLSSFGSFFGGSSDNKSKMAAGGIVTQATSLIAGEAGPEAIIPLNKLTDIIQATLVSNVSNPSTSQSGGNAGSPDNSNKTIEVLTAKLDQLNNTTMELVRHMKDTAENTKRTHDATKALNGNLFAV
jgi:hypothetical protein